MLNIAICDDEKTSIDRIADKISNYCAAKNIDFNVDTYNRGEELLGVDTTDFDIIFLDVDMGTMDGIDTAREIRKRSKEVVIIYVSGYVQYAPAGYGVKAFAYILKNDIDALFDSVMDEVVNEIEQTADIYKLRIENKDVTVVLKDIVFIESFNKTVDIHHIRGDKYTVKSQINDIYRELKPKGFLQIHKSYLVNMQHITCIKNYIVTLSNGCELTASQRRWKDIIANYLEWKGRI